jgi:hypothetical protein
MKLILSLSCALTGIIGILTAGYFWGNNLLVGGHNSFSWPYGWAWPLLSASAIFITIIIAFKIIFLPNLNAMEIFLRAVLPFIFSSLVAIAFFILIAR